MGRTVPTFHLLIDDAIARWSKFRRALRPLPLGVAVFSDATSFETPRRAGCGLYLEPARKNMFGQLAAQATQLWRFALDEEGGKLRLIGEKSCSPGL